MGYVKTRRPEVSTPIETLGSTAGDIAPWPPVTVVTATATGLVYQLPVPQPGFEKTVIVDYTGATGNLTLANVSTGTVFNGSTANVITVSSSEEHAIVRLIGITTAQWAADWGATPTTAAWPVAYAGSTVTS